MLNFLKKNALTFHKKFLGGSYGGHRHDTLCHIKMKISNAKKRKFFSKLNAPLKNVFFFHFSTRPLEMWSVFLLPVSMDAGESLMASTKPRPFSVLTEIFKKIYKIFF